MRFSQEQPIIQSEKVIVYQQIKNEIASKFVCNSVR